MDPNMKKAESYGICSAPQSEREPSVKLGEGIQRRQEEIASELRNKKHYSFYLSILMLSLIALIVSWDVTALSLALPVIAKQLDGTSFQSFWASIAYILGIAISQPIYASVSDVVGRKYPLYVSVILFSIGTIIFATAKSMNVIVAARLIKGLGGGGLDVLQTIILCDITTLKERPKWLGVMSMANAVGAVTGPFIGGAFAEKIGWPWLGWLNLITAGATGALAFFFLHLKPIEGDIKKKMSVLDWAGFGFFTVISTIIALPLSWAGMLFPWGSWQTLFPLLAGLALLLPFSYIEKKAKRPIIPYQIFNNVSIITGTICGFIYGSLLNSILLYLPLFFQAAFLETPIAAARSTLPLCCLFVVMSIVASIIIDWTRKYRIILWASWSITTVFLGLNYTVGTGTSRVSTYTFQALLGAGLGTALMATMVSVLASVTRADDDGLAAGMLVTMRFVGSLIGLAVCSTVFSSVFSHSFSSMKNLPEQLALLKDSSQAVSFIPRLREIDVPEDILRAVIGAYEDSFRIIWVVLAAFSAAGALLSVLTREKTLEKDDVGRQGFNVSPSE